MADPLQRKPNGALLRIPNGDALQRAPVDGCCCDQVACRCCIGDSFDVVIDGFTYSSSGETPHPEDGCNQFAIGTVHTLCTLDCPDIIGGPLEVDDWTVTVVCCEVEPDVFEMYVSINAYRECNGGQPDILSGSSVPQRTNRCVEPPPGSYTFGVPIYRSFPTPNELVCTVTVEINNIVDCSDTGGGGEGGGGGGGGGGGPGV